MLRRGYRSKGGDKTVSCRKCGIAGDVEFAEDLEGVAIGRRSKTVML